MLRRVLSTTASFLVAFAVIVIFEYSNSIIFPFPDGFDMTNMESVRMFTQSLPWNAYILVWLGWVSGSLIAGWLSITLSKSSSMVSPLIIGSTLTIVGLINNVMLGAPLWVTILGLFLFIPPALGGWAIAVKE